MNQIISALTIIISILSLSAFGRATSSEIKFDALCEEAMNAPSLPLIAINDSNTNLIRHARRIKVARWMSEASLMKRFSKLSHTPVDRDVWVTIAPEVSNFCGDFTHKTDIQMDATCPELSSIRIDLYLGLRPDPKSKKVLVQFFVDQASLIRPCINPDPSTASCSRETQDATPGLPDMTSFLRAKFGSEQGGNLDPVACLPFTGMGYTFDWGSKDDFQGATEFILLPNSAIFDLEVLSFQEACGCQALETA